jgi:hypothetical protein
MAIHEPGAFFAGASWPERGREAGRAFTQFLQLNPTIAHIGFVESYAVGPDAVRRVEDSLTAFTIFLQEGHRHTSQTARSTNQLALGAIATTTYELAYHESRRERSRQLSNLLGHVSFLCLAPFIGPAEANRFIDEKLSASHEHATGPEGP